MKQTFTKNKRVFSQAGGGASSGLNYKGTWDANANSPLLASGVGTAGDYYIVSVAGSTDLDGITDWDIDDWAIFNGTVWQKIDNSENGLVPYTGAVQDVDLGEYGISAGQFNLDTSPTGTPVVGSTTWNDSLGSSETLLKGGSVTLKNGVDLVARVVNKVVPNTTLTKAQYQVVKVSGASGQRLAIDLAQANNDNNSADTLGVVTETIATNQEGFIITVGQLENINTTGSLQGESWLDGDVLYLSGTTPGAITNIKPVAPIHIVVIGYVEYRHAVNGKIYVKIMNGWELDELHNVYINTGTLANNDVLTYNSSTQLWENKPPSGGGVNSATNNLFAYYNFI
jgi:nitrogen fixation protein